MFRKTAIAVASAAALGLAAAGAAAQDEIPVGHLVAYTGPTSDVGQIYGQGIEDAIAYINEHGGINGKLIHKETVDYGYEIPRAVAAYKRWQSSLQPVVIQGWGTSDTEALVPFVTRDEIVYMSASYSGHLTDPTGEAEHSPYAAPYNFFYGPSYSDGCRAMASWAMEDWKASAGEGQPQWVHMGANHPYPNAPKAACTAWAEELGFEVLPNITYALTPGDFKAQCLSLKSTGADYAYLANTSAANVALMKACETVGVDVQFVTNVWGFDELAAPAAGSAADGLVLPVGAATWESDAPGMETVRAISKVSDSSGEKARALHYMRGVCSVFFMRDAMRMADEQGEITSQTVKAALESMEDHVPAELEGVCLPHTWTPTSHRGTTKVMVYQNHWNDGEFEFEHLTTVELPRGEQYLGW